MPFALNKRKATIFVNFPDISTFEINILPTPLAGYGDLKILKICLKPIYGLGTQYAVNNANHFKPTWNDNIRRFSSILTSGSDLPPTFLYLGHLKYDVNVFDDFIGSFNSVFWRNCEMYLQLPHFEFLGNILFPNNKLAFDESFKITSVLHTTLAYILQIDWRNLNFKFKFYY